MNRPKNGSPLKPLEQFSNPSALANTTPANNRADDLVLNYLKQDIDKLEDRQSEVSRGMGALATQSANLQAELVKLSLELTELKNSTSKLEHHRTAIWAGVAVIFVIGGLLGSIYGDSFRRMAKFADEPENISKVEQLVDSDERVKALKEIADERSLKHGGQVVNGSR